MCYSAEISLLAYLVGLYGSSLLWQHNLKSEAIFYGWVIQMQLIEYLLWSNKSCNQTNVEITKWGVIINHLEPFVLWLAILYFRKQSVPDWLNNSMLMFALATVWYTQKAIESNESCTQVTEESEPHLYWAWTEGEYGGYIIQYF